MLDNILDKKDTEIYRVMGRKTTDLARENQWIDNNTYNKFIGLLKDRKIIRKGKKMTEKKITTEILKEMKKKGEKITMLTAYDALMAAQLDECGIEMILVGDSVANVLLGYENTIPVTMEEMLHHCRAVTRAVKGRWW